MKGKLVIDSVLFYDVVVRVHRCVVDRWRRNALFPLRKAFNCLRSCFSLGSL
jgi:hypothetical protein